MLCLQCSSETHTYISKIYRIEEIICCEVESFFDPRIKEIYIISAYVCIEVYGSNTIKEYQQFAYENTC